MATAFRARRERRENIERQQAEAAAIKAAEIAAADRQRKLAEIEYLKKYAKTREEHALVKMFQRMERYYKAGRSQDYVEYKLIGTGASPYAKIPQSKEYFTAYSPKAMQIAEARSVHTYTKDTSSVKYKSGDKVGKVTGTDIDVYKYDKDTYIAFTKRGEQTKLIERAKQQSAKKEKLADMFSQRGRQEGSYTILKKEQARLYRTGDKAGASAIGKIAPTFAQFQGTIKDKAGKDIFNATRTLSKGVTSKDIMLAMRGTSMGSSDFLKAVVSKDRQGLIKTRPAEKEFGTAVYFEPTTTPYVKTGYTKDGVNYAKVIDTGKASIIPTESFLLKQKLENTQLNKSLYGAAEKEMEKPLYMRGYVMTRGGGVTALSYITQKLPKENKIITSYFKGDKSKSERYYESKQQGAISNKAFLGKVINKITDKTKESQFYKTKQQGAISNKAFLTPAGNVIGAFTKEIVGKKVNYLKGAVIKAGQQYQEQKVIREQKKGMYSPDFKTPKGFVESGVRFATDSIKDLGKKGKQVVEFEAKIAAAPLVYQTKQVLKPLAAEGATHAGLYGGGLIQFKKGKYGSAFALGTLGMTTGLLEDFTKNPARTAVEFYGAGKVIKVVGFGKFALGASIGAGVLQPAGTGLGERVYASTTTGLFFAAPVIAGKGIELGIKGINKASAFGKAISKQYIPENLWTENLLRTQARVKIKSFKDMFRVKKYKTTTSTTETKTPTTGLGEIKSDKFYQSLYNKKVNKVVGGTKKPPKRYTTKGFVRALLGDVSSGELLGKVSSGEFTTRKLTQKEYLRSIRRRADRQPSSKIQSPKKLYILKGLKGEQQKIYVTEKDYFKMVRKRAPKQTKDFIDMKLDELKKGSSLVVQTKERGFEFKGPELEQPKAGEDFNFDYFGEPTKKSIPFNERVKRSITRADRWLYGKLTYEPFIKIKVKGKAGVGYKQFKYSLGLFLGTTNKPIFVFESGKEGRFIDSMGGLSTFVRKPYGRPEFKRTFNYGTKGIDYKPTNAYEIQKSVFDKSFVDEIVIIKSTKPSTLGLKKFFGEKPKKGKSFIEKMIVDKQGRVQVQEVVLEQAKAETQQAKQLFEFKSEKKPQAPITKTTAKSKKQVLIQVVKTEKKKKTELELILDTLSIYNKEEGLLGQSPFQKIGNVSRIGIDSRMKGITDIFSGTDSTTKEKDKLGTIFNLKYGTKQSQKQQQGISQMFKQDAKQKQRSISKLEFKPAQIENIMQKQQQRQRQEQIQETVQPERIEIIKEVFFPRTEKKKEQGVQAYHAYVRQGVPRGKGQPKKEVRVTKKPMPMNKAWNRGARITDETASASFTIRKAGKTKTKEADTFSRYNSYKFTSPRSTGKIKKAPYWVEKNAYRIDAEGERQGITVKGWLARERKSRGSNVFNL